MFAAVTQCYNSVFRRGHVDPRDMQRSAAVQLSETEAYVTTDITLVRQMAELKMLGDRWRKMAAERQIKLNDGTPDNLLRRLERVEDTIDHTRVEWSLAVRTPADHSAALWLDVDTLLDNESALMMHLEQLQIRGKDVQVAVSVCDLHILSAIGERCWQLAAVMLTGAVLRETAPNMPYYTEAAPLASSLRVLSIPGVESRVRALTVKGIRTRVFHRGRGEFAFVFSRKTPRGPLRRNEARPGTQKQLGAVRDGADEAGEAEEDHTGGVAAEVEAVMRHIVRDLSTALRHDLPLELLLPQNLRAVEVRRRGGERRAARRCAVGCAAAGSAARCGSAPWGAPRDAPCGAAVRRAARAQGRHLDRPCGVIAAVLATRVRAPRWMGRSARRAPAWRARAGTAAAPSPRGARRAQPDAYAIMLTTNAPRAVPAARARAAPRAVCITLRSRAAAPPAATGGGHV